MSKTKRCEDCVEYEGYNVGSGKVICGVITSGEKCDFKKKGKWFPGPHPDPFLNGPTFEEDCLP